MEKGSKERKGKVMYERKGKYEEEKEIEKTWSQKLSVEREKKKGRSLNSKR